VSDVGRIEWVPIMVCESHGDAKRTLLTHHGLDTYLHEFKSPSLC
jgi:hypothetical protein